MLPLCSSGRHVTPSEVQRPIHFIQSRRLPERPLRDLRLGLEGRVVTRLDYQAYSKMAIKTMSDILRKAHEQFARSAHTPEGTYVRTLIKCAVHHRLGTVPVGEPSIVIAVSLSCTLPSSISLVPVECVICFANFWEHVVLTPVPECISLVYYNIQY